MSKKWYGSLENRLEENNMFCERIEVGTGMTEYFYSDRHPYEVIEVQDQKHVTVRAMKHKKAENSLDFSNDWTLESDPASPERYLVKHGNYWYWTCTVTAEYLESIEEDIDEKIRLSVAGYNFETIREKGKQTKRYRANVSFGKADYYYDYSF